MLAFLSHFGPLEIVLVLIALLLLFGKRLPEVGRSLGSGMIEFKKGLQGVKDDVDPNKPVPAATTAASAAQPQPPADPPAASVATAALAATCPECQAPRPTDATFCPKCGAKLA